MNEFHYGMLAGAALLVLAAIVMAWERPRAGQRRQPGSDNRW